MPSVRWGRWLATVLVLAGGTTWLGAQVPPGHPAEVNVSEAPAASPLPFPVGERLEYRVRGSKLGAAGKATMRVDGPADVRGTHTYVLRSTVEMRVGPIKAVNRTESWIDPFRMASLRFKKHERTLISSHDELVEMFPERGRWQGKGGRTGALTTDAPLDELSFIYFIRTLPLDADVVYRLDRHFDPTRNPTVIRVVGRESVSTPAGRFETVVVEMRVKDAARYGGEGVIRINLTDDTCRLPVRIESSVPVVGTAVLTLQAHTHPAVHFAAR